MGLRTDIALAERRSTATEPHASEPPHGQGPNRHWGTGEHGRFPDGDDTRRQDDPSNPPLLPHLRARRPGVARANGHGRRVPPSVPQPHQRRSTMTKWIREAPSSRRSPGRGTEIRTDRPISALELSGLRVRARQAPCTGGIRRLCPPAQRRADRPATSGQARGTTDRTIRDGRTGSWKTCCRAARAEVPPAPVRPLTLRSERGKLLEVTWARMRGPAPKTTLVDHRSTRCSAGSPGVAPARTRPSATLRETPFSSTSHKAGHPLGRGAPR